MPATFAKAQQEAILRVTAYHRRDFDISLIRSHPNEHVAILRSIVEPFSSNALVGLGNLARFPMEVLRLICINSDVRSCWNLRRANRRWRDVVSGIFEYRMLATHGLECIRAVLRTGFAPYVTFSELFGALCTSECELCESTYGSALFLPTVTRCCFPCLKTSDRVRITSVSALAQHARVSIHKLRQWIPTFRTLPGVYAMDRRSRMNRVTIVWPPRATRGVHWLRDISVRRAREIIGNAPEIEAGRFMASVGLPFFDPATGEVDHGVCCKGCQVENEEGSNDGTEEYDWDRNFVYSKEAYLKHFRECRESRRMWHKSKEGTVTVDEPDFTRRLGYYSWMDES